jgi:hypothetical protein
VVELGVFVITSCFLETPTGLLHEEDSEPSGLPTRIQVLFSGKKKKIISDKKSSSLEA